MGWGSVGSERRVEIGSRAGAGPQGFMGLAKGRGGGGAIRLIGFSSGGGGVCARFMRGYKQER
jgi:hypothetical protein